MGESSSVQQKDAGLERYQLDELLPDGFSVAASAIEIHGGSEGPLRAIAILPEAAAESSAEASSPD